MIVTNWKGVDIEKMTPARLKAALQEAVTELARLTSPSSAPPGEVKTADRELPKPPLDPQTERCLRELRDVIRMIETGEVGLTRFLDELVDAGRLQRQVAITATFNPPKAKP